VRASDIELFSSARECGERAKCVWISGQVQSNDDVINIIRINGLLVFSSVTTLTSTGLGTRSASVARITGKAVAGTLRTETHREPKKAIKNTNLGSIRPGGALLELKVARCAGADSHIWESVAA